MKFAILVPTSCWILCAGVWISSSALAYETDGPAGSLRQARVRPYCGLYCVYAAGIYLGKQIDFADMVKVEYLSLGQGSSLGDVEQAARDQGLYATTMTELTERVLWSSPYPVILLVKLSKDSLTYDHYVLFLGIRDGKAIILDPPSAPDLVPSHQLSWRWSKYGVVISNNPIDEGRLLAPERWHIARVGGVGVAILLLLYAVFHRKGTRARGLPVSSFLGWSAFELGGLTGVALLVGLLNHLTSDSGFLAHPGATAPIKYAHLDHFVPKVRADEVERLLREDNLVFVDAREGVDFERGHLEGALSVSITASEGERMAAVSGVPRGSRMVVYCQSVSCTYAKNVAAWLMSRGYTNVALFPGGWEEWENWKKKSTSREAGKVGGN